MEMEIKLGYENNMEIKELFLEYTEMLVKMTRILQSIWNCKIMILNLNT